MKIVIEDPATQDQEDTITISVKRMTNKILRAIDILKHPDDITVYLDNRALLLPATDILYIESVDLKTFVYTRDKVFLSKLKLYEVEELLSQDNFLRGSKQIIINLDMVQNIAPAGGGRFEALLLNDEKVIITRQYVPFLKKRFGL